MIPIVEDLLKSFITTKLNVIKDNPDIINETFKYVDEAFITRLKQYLVKGQIKVTLGYPREHTLLPCYCIMLGQESEEGSSLGDSYDNYINDEEEYVEESGTTMAVNYRIECWSDNGDLTVFMYQVLKYLVLRSRNYLVGEGLLIPTITGGDLEPITDMYPSFVYRRALIINGKVENTFTDEFEELVETIEEIEQELVEYGGRIDEII